MKCEIRGTDSSSRLKKQAYPKQCGIHFPEERFIEFDATFVLVYSVSELTKTFQANENFLKVT
jgi:hypothetical protein